MTIRRFVLVRHHDPSGNGGSGAVADGVQWPDGTLALRWRGQWAATTVWPHGMTALLDAHRHGGSTTVEWIDQCDDADPDIEYDNGAIWVH